MLIAAVLAGDEQAFAQLVRRYEAALLRAAISRLGRRELAEEAVQETFLAALRWLHTYDSRFSFRTWLWTIVLQQSSRVARREARQPKCQTLVAEPTSNAAANLADGLSPLEHLLEREQGEHLADLLSRLPEVQADALRLRFFGGLTYPEIAAAMQCSEPGAKHRVKAGLLQLSKWLGAGANNPCPAKSGELP